jgi:hypothetical protein
VAYRNFRFLRPNVEAAAIDAVTYVLAGHLGPDGLRLGAATWIVAQP